MSALNKNRPDFRKGDRLVCVSPVRDHTFLTMGKVYEAVKGEEAGIFADRPYITVMGDDGVRLCCHSYRFAKVGMGGQYEAVLPGFFGGSDATDHLVKWVLADDISQVRRMYPDARITQVAWDGGRIAGLDHDLRAEKVFY